MLIVEETPEKSFLIFLLSPALGTGLGTQMELPPEQTCTWPWNEA